MAGNNSGYLGLFNANNKVQQSKDNLNILRDLSNQVDNHRKQEEESQARIAAIKEQIRKETDVLLTSDKNAIRNKARNQFKNIATQIQAYGGKYSTFLAQGGRALIEDYKSSILSSKEMGEYQENSQNMAKILELEKTGKGHLINAIDRANLERYRTNGGGKISYTGVMNEVEMPPSENWDWNTDVPAINILKHKDNYLKIYGNYIKSFPNLGEPKEADLIQYVKSQYAQRGSNWQRGHSADQLAQQDRHFNANLQQRQYEFETESAFRLMDYEAKLNQFSGGDGNTKAGSGGVEGAWKEESQVANVNQVTSMIDGKNLNYNSFSKGTFWDEKINTIGGEASEVGYTKWKMKGYAGQFQGSGTIKTLSGTYSPMNAMRIKSLDANAAAKAIFGVDNVDKGMIRGIITNKSDFYGADGRKFSDNSRLFYDYLGAGSKARDFKIEAVVTVGTIKDGNSKDVILMDQYGTFGAKEQKYNRDIKTAAADKNVKLQNMVVARHPKTNEIIYIPFEISNVDVQNAYATYAPSDVLTNQRIMANNASFKNKYTQEQTAKQASDNRLAIQSMMSDDQATAMIAKQGQMYSYGGSKNRSKLVSAFYMALSGQEKDPSVFRDWVQSNQIGNVIATNDKVKKMISQGYSDEQVIQYLSQTDKSGGANDTMYKHWLSNLQYLKGRG